MSRLEEMRALLNREVDKDGLQNKLLEKTASFDELMETIVEYANFPDTKVRKKISDNGQTLYISLDISFREKMEKEYSDFGKYHMSYQEIQNKVKDFPYSVSVIVRFKEYYNQLYDRIKNLFEMSSGEKELLAKTGESMKKLTPYKEYFFKHNVKRSLEYWLNVLACHYIAHDDFENRQLEYSKRDDVIAYIENRRQLKEWMDKEANNSKEYFAKHQEWASERMKSLQKGEKYDVPEPKYVRSQCPNELKCPDDLHLFYDCRNAYYYKLKDFQKDDVEHQKEKINCIIDDILLMMEEIYESAAIENLKKECLEVLEKIENNPYDDIMMPKLPAPVKLSNGELGAVLTTS